LALEMASERHRELLIKHASSWLRENGHLRK
jgi:hypothetical protein